jgi:sugar O-acyltransferase (sialic acid O-acetyltransferase NeuD family)
MNAFIFGAGGFAKEVEWLISECEIQNRPNIFAFVAHSSDPLVGSQINGIPVLSEEEYLETWNQKELHEIYIAISAPKIKKKIIKKISNQFTQFPNLIHPNVTMDKRENAILIGKGVIICTGVFLMTSISIGDFVHINLACTIGHDCVIGHYSTISPGVSISGNVKIGEETYLGTRVCTVENIQIDDKIIIGAGAVVVKSLSEEGTYVGAPAKKVEKSESYI